MIRTLTDLFRKVQTPRDPFVDAALGEFDFYTKLGWKRNVQMDDTAVELVLGSDGEPPSDAMLRTARSWIESWRELKPRLLDYARQEISTWTIENDPPNPDEFILQSLNILWPDTPNTCMIYFHNPVDDDRCFHLTLDGFEPRGFAYDH